jgi:hypothetical protein
MDPTLLPALGLAAGGAVASGLRVYGTAAALGWLDRMGVMSLPPGLDALAQLPVVALATLLYVAEFLADKIPAFDSVWDAIHTFVRVPAAGVLGFAALGELSEPWRMTAALLCGGVALSTHGLKSGARLAVNASPEPLSNWGLSLGEDLGFAGLLWLMLEHPLATLFLAGAVLVAGALVAVWLVRVLRRLLAGPRAPAQPPPTGAG